MSTIPNSLASSADMNLSLSVSRSKTEKYPKGKLKLRANSVSSVVIIHEIKMNDKHSLHAHTHTHRHTDTQKLRKVTGLYISVQTFVLTNCLQVRSCVLSQEFVQKSPQLQELFSMDCDVTGLTLLGRREKEREREGGRADRHKHPHPVPQWIHEVGES